MAKSFITILGSIFLLIGLIGWMSGSHAHNLMIFGVNMPHNLVHIFTGVTALAVALAGEAASRMFCFIFGAVYGLVTLAGFFNVDSVVTLLNLNTADNFLHLGVSAGCLIVGWMSRRSAMETHAHAGPSIRHHYAGRAGR